MISVELTPSEMAIAGEVGVLRRISSIKKGLANTVYSPDKQNWQIDIEGACAELACAKALDLYWGAGVNTFKAADIGGKIQVRSTESRCLCIRKNDPDDDIYILVTGKAPHYIVRGWIKGKDAKNPKYIRDPNNIGKPLYMVPPEELNPIEQIKRGA